MRSILLVVLILISTTVGAQVISDFTTNADGWTAPNSLGGAIIYSGTGGNPGGYVQGQTPMSIILGATTLWFPYYFEAPAKFEGNKSAYYGGSIRYDAAQSSTGAPVQYAQAVITTNAGVSIYYYPAVPIQPPTYGTWTRFDIPLSAATGEWKTTDAPGGTAATQAQVLAALTDIATLQIQGLYRNANVSTRLDNITMYPAINITTQPVTTTICENLTATFSTAANNNPNITYQWQLFNPFSGYQNISDGGGYSGTTTATLSINTTGNFGAGQYRARISGLNVNPVNTNAATLTINPAPTAPGATGGFRCGTGTVPLTATGGAAGQYRWYTVATLGTPIPGQTAATYTTPVISSTTNYWVAINNGTCESTRTMVTATVNPIPAAPGVNGAARCGTGTVTLSATGGSAGQYRWYTVATLGTPLPGQTAATYTTPSIATTTNYWVAINNGSCEGARTLVVATVNTPPTAPGATGASNCGNGSIALTATGGAAGQYRWYTVATLGTPLPGQTAATYTTPVISSTTNYWVAINNGTCESTRTMAVATINTIPGTPGQIGATGCNPGSVTLQATGGLPGQYRWYTSSTGPTQIAGEVNNTYTTPILTATTQYWVSINNGICESGRIATVASMIGNPQPPTVTGASGCGTTTVTLTANGGTPGQYRWYTVASSGTPIAGQTNATFTTPAISSTTSYWVSINNGTCESSRTEVVATIGGQACQNNTPPVIETTIASTTIGGMVTINLEDLISDTDNNLVLSTLTIVSPPPSGATATIDGNFNLIIDYSGKPFNGIEKMSISVCDSFGACTIQELSIDVLASIEVYNAVSPNKDGKNDVFYIDGIEKIEDTRKNKVMIFNRWGDLVWEGNDYNNTTVVFAGLSKSNAELPAGTYFYKIEFASTKGPVTGYLSLVR